MVGAFDAFDDVAEGGFGDLVWCARVGAPASEAASESVRHGDDVEFAQQFAHRAVGELASCRCREYQPGRIRVGAGFCEGVEGAPAERHAVRFVGFRALRGDGPRRGVGVDLASLGAAHFARAARCEGEVLEGEFRGRRRVRGPHRRHRSGDGAVGERPVVRDAPGLARQRGAYGRACGVVVAVVLCDRPAHDQGDALAQPFRRSALSLQIGATTLITSPVVSSATDLAPMCG